MIRVLVMIVLLAASSAAARWYDSEGGIFLSRDSIGASSYLSGPNGMGPHSYANLSPGRYTDPDGRRAADCARLGLHMGTDEWNNNPLCSGSSSGSEIGLAYKAYAAEQRYNVARGDDVAPAEREYGRLGRAFVLEQESRQKRETRLGRPLFVASAAMAGVGSATACALNPWCDAAAAKSAGPILTYGLFSSGVGTWSAVHNWAGSCWTSVTGGGEEASAADAECWFGVGVASTGVKPTLQAAEKLGRSVVGTIYRKVRVGGAAQSPRLAPYRPNPSGVIRTPEEAIEMARAEGIRIDDDVKIGFIKNWKRRDAQAEYGQLGGVDPHSRLSWDDFVNPLTEKVPVRLNASLLESDEAVIAHLAHEMHEINRLREIFAQRETLSAVEFQSLVGPGVRNNLHDEAWDIADLVVAFLRDRH